MDAAAVGRCAELLLAARRGREAVAGLPEELRPRDLAAAYAVQDEVVRRHGGPCAGYKVGASSETAQALLGVVEPFSGRLFLDRRLDSPAVLSAGDTIFRLIEPEFAFRFADDLPARDGGYDEAAVGAAVAALHPAIEVVTSAFGRDWTTAGGAALIADNGAHAALVLGPACSDWRGLDLAGHAVALAVNGRPAGSGHGANALGGPLTALAWLVNHLCARGRGIVAGEIVTTGLVTEFAYLEAGDRAVADYGTLGTVEVQFR